MYICVYYCTYRKIHKFHKYIFIIIVSGGSEALFCIYSHLQLLKGHSAVKYHPRRQFIQGLEVNVRLGRLPDLNCGLVWPRYQ
jgi:hypothetical protein